ncbi:RNA demethylase ALKBH10B [Cardamine amara subsp. amara]|uniref:RNA demethylase ALKBH10B n=1 Tax=Cardamine amara subsp. amara TaxID=228776 RepID=A0ABD1CA01_CARAN
MAETVNRSAQPPVLLSDSAAMITWFHGEFAAANAIIDALCGHLMEGFGSAEYEGVMAALHRRRLNWIPVLQMQKYHSISQVTLELQTATAKRLDKAAMEIIDDDSPSSDITDSGSREEERVDETITICWKHEEECESRASLIKQSKRFSAKEHVRGHTANVVKGLKLYEHVFTGTQLSKLLDYVNQLRDAGRNQQLSGDTFVLFNKNSKGTKRELLQLGVPIFGNTTDEHSVEPIPTLVQSVIDHLLEWRVIPEYKRPNGCVINFFDEEEHSQPFQKPPHVDQPISTLVLSESTMVFGHRLGVDNDGNFRGSLTLPLKEGSLLVMRGNSADMARHVMCPSPNKRVAITFFKLKPDSSKVQPPPTTNPVTLWPPGTPAPPVFGMVRAPLVMLAPAPKRLDAGTGVFLPWTPPVSRKLAKHLPPRVQRLRLLSSATSVEDRDIGVS